MLSGSQTKRVVAMFIMFVLIIASVLIIANKCCAANQCLTQCPFCKTKLVQAVAITDTYTSVYLDIYTKTWNIGGYIGEYIFRCAEGHTWRCFESTSND